MRAVDLAKSQKHKIYVIDETFVNSIKVLISAEDSSSSRRSETSDADLKKQWLGFLLIAKTFDAQISKIDENIFAKNINILLNTICNVINKNPILSEIAVAAVRAWRSLTQMLSSMYDQKSHAAALLVLKSIC